MESVTINIDANSISNSNVATVNDSNLIKAIVESNDKIVQRLLDTIERQSIIIEHLKGKLSQQKTANYSIIDNIES